MKNVLHVRSLLMKTRRNHYFIYAIIAGILTITSGCKKDDRAENGFITGAVTDIDGNVYQTISLDNQEWMAENLKTTRFNDGGRIDSPGDDNQAWINNISGAYSWYNNDIINKDYYGALYNWYAVKSGKLCPAGWHVPSDAEWTIINRFLAGNAGDKLKQSHAGRWQGSNINATNETGFNALPGGVRFSGASSGNTAHGYFYYKGKTGRWWSSSEQSSTEAWYRSIYFDSGNVFRSYNSKATGFSVRCVRSWK
jgi:uncharacterized protein (TIGR02145 family)